MSRAADCGDPDWATGLWENGKSLVRVVCTGSPGGQAQRLLSGADGVTFESASFYFYSLVVIIVTILEAM